MSIANTATESIEGRRLKGLLTDTQAACWLVVAAGSYAVISMAVLPLSVAGVLLVIMVVGSIYAARLAGVDLLIPEHAALFPGLNNSNSSRHTSDDDEIPSPEVTPRVPPEPQSNRKRSMGSSGTTRASLEEDVPLETPDTTPTKLAMPTPPTMATSGENGGRSGSGHQLESEDSDVSSNRVSIPSTLRNALSFKGDEAMRFRVKGTFLHVEYPRGEDEMSDELECNPPGASREGSVDASVLSASEEGSVVADSSEALAGVRRFRRRRSISDADLTYTAYLAELAMEQHEGNIGERSEEDSVEEGATQKPSESGLEATDPVAGVALGPRVEIEPTQKPVVAGVPTKGLNPNAPEFVPQRMNRPWLSIEVPPPGISGRRPAAGEVFRQGR